MKIAFWGKGNDSLDKAVKGVLTAKDAQKMTDAALEAKTARLGQMAYESALRFIAEAVARAEYSIRYGLYTCGLIASEIKGDELTVTQAREIESFVYNKLTELGYYVELSYYGPKRMIEISWKKV